jgi:hypothetical protein
MLRKSIQRCTAAHHFFCNCILQGAIDFAEMRKRSWSSGAKCSTLFGVAGFAPNSNFERALGATPLLTPQPTVQIFKQLFLQVQFARVQLILR